MIKKAMDKTPVKTFGYARVSSREQNEARQIASLLEAGVEERDILIDKQSGKSFDRPQYQALIDRLREGDTLIICSIDRLGRDYTAIMNEWRRITQKVKANIRVLDMPLLDTASSENTLDGRFVADLVLQILSYVAEKERSSMKERQRQGIEVAKAQGKHLGRSPIKEPDGFQAVYEKWKAGDNKITAVEAMRSLGIKKTSFYKLVRQYEGRGKQ